MSKLLLKRIKSLKAQGKLNLLNQIQHGLEKECLRVDKQSELSLRPHPHSLGAALTHPYITTDYSEALLEFITPVYTRIEDALQFLFQLHQFAYQALPNELLWSGSMPCLLEGEDKIPIANYGSSNVGLMKSAYRRGLWHRYGKHMQTIAGIHYNFSLPKEFWSTIDQGAEDEKDLQSRGYFALIRNFRRYAWLLMYLFGASPAVDRSFFHSKTHNDLDKLHENTLYLPYATSLRMSDLGYTNSAQSELNICFNSLDNYIDSMERAIQTPYPAYEGIPSRPGNYQQLNSNILQIENEYYTVIRPKRVAKSAQWPIDALREKGVEYIEVRCLDLDPMLPLGIESKTGHFVDTFLLWCALSDSPSIETLESNEIDTNFNLTVARGREPRLKLHCHGNDVSLSQWGLELMDELELVAGVMDEASSSSGYTESVHLQRAKLKNSNLTPSAKMFQKFAKGEYIETLQSISKGHEKSILKVQFDAKISHYLADIATKSHRDLEHLEGKSKISFEGFLKEYFRR